MPTGRILQLGESCVGGAWLDDCELVAILQICFTALYGNSSISLVGGLVFQHYVKLSERYEIAERVICDMMEVPLEAGGSSSLLMS